MIRAFTNYFSAIPSVVIDGWLYVLIAFFGACAAVFTTDEAAKYVAPFWLWIFRGVCTVNSAWLLALKMFRSTAFADHQAAKRGDTKPPFSTGT